METDIRSFHDYDVVRERQFGHDCEIVLVEKPGAVPIYQETEVWRLPLPRPRLERRDDSGAAILVEAPEETLRSIWMPCEAGAADPTERQHDVILDAKQELQETQVHVLHQFRLDETVAPTTKGVPGVASFAMIINLCLRRQRG